MTCNPATPGSVSELVCEARAPVEIPAILSQGFGAPRSRRRSEAHPAAGGLLSGSRGGHERSPENREADRDYGHGWHDPPGTWGEETKADDIVVGQRDDATSGGGPGPGAGACGGNGDQGSEFRRRSVNFRACGGRATGGYRVLLSGAGDGGIRGTLDEPGEGALVTRALTQTYVVAGSMPEAGDPPLRERSRRASWLALYPLGRYRRLM